MTSSSKNPLKILKNWFLGRKNFAYCAYLGVGSLTRYIKKSPESLLIREGSLQGGGVVKLDSHGIMIISLELVFRIKIVANCKLKS